jgi:hypothetical protein
MLQQRSIIILNCWSFGASLSYKAHTIYQHKTQQVSAKDEYKLISYIYIYTHTKVEEERYMWEDWINDVYICSFPAIKPMHPLV